MREQFLYMVKGGRLASLAAGAGGGRRKRPQAAVLAGVCLALRAGSDFEIGDASDEAVLRQGRANRRVGLVDNHACALC